MSSLKSDDDESYTTVEIDIAVAAVVLVCMVGIGAIIYCCCCRTTGKESPEGTSEETPLTFNITGGEDAKNIAKLRTLLSKGLQATLHTSKRPKKIKMTIVGYELRWETVNSKGEKSNYALDMNSVLFIEKGKQTAKFKAASASGVQDDLCVSLVSNTASLDVEVSTKDDRETLYNGFNSLLDYLRRKSTV
jgi:hypothetical protein